jgi:hypothetical protein
MIQLVQCIPLLIKYINYQLYFIALQTTPPGEIKLANTRPEFINKCLNALGKLNLNSEKHLF